MWWSIRYRKFWRSGVIFVVVAMVSPFCLGQDRGEDLESRVRTLWEQQKSVWNAGGILEKDKTPPVDSDTGFWVCPDHQRALEPVRLSGNNRMFVNALICMSGQHLWVVRSKGPGIPLQWRGPFSMKEGESSTSPKKGEETGTVPSKQEVLRALYEHFTDSGQQGFYQDRFANLRKWKGPVLIEHLSGIFETDANAQIRMLALEALGELGTREIMPQLHSWIQDPTIAGAFKLNVAVVLARLGDRTVLDRVFQQWTLSANRALENGDKKGASSVYGQMALMHARLQEVDASVTFYQKAIDLDPKNAGAYYNLACTYAKSNRKDEAFAALNMALENGFKNLEWMLRDGDLRALHEDPRWKDIQQKK